MPPKKKKLTREEILERKRIAERLRYQRLKSDPQKSEELREKEQIKYLKKKEKGTRKLVKDMNDREHRAAKKTWKVHCATYRSKKKNLKELTSAFAKENTPISDTEQATPASPTVSITSSLRKQRAKRLRQKILKDKDEKLAEYKKKLEKYRKRLQRLQKDGKKNKVNDTPNTKLNKLMETPESQKVVVKKALFGEVLNEQLKANYAKMKTTKEKQIFGKVVSGPLVEKYKLWRNESSAISYKTVKKSAVRSSLLPPRQTRNDGISWDCVLAVRKFYQRDDNSRLGAGKREFLTRKGVRKQKRYLLDTIFNLYKKFKKAENFDISYQKFCLLRPFWVVTRKANERDTCICITHANVDLKLSALNARKILPYSKHQNLLADICCDRYNESCLSRECDKCVNKYPSYNEFDDSKPVTFKKWIAEKQDFVDPKTKKVRAVTKYMKKDFEVSPRELTNLLHEDLDFYLTHERNITHQFKAIKNLKENLTEKDVIIHMDFSENYAVKYGEEIQAFHFGGSRSQISLHTVVVYTNNSIKSYCTVSKDTTHSPASIWAHLEPIFQTLPPQINCVHFVSDGPVTQYRNKTMFFILASKLQEQVANVQRFSWNYTETGHGKGAPDGVGATCKRTADFVVAAGGDVPDLETFVQTIQDRCPKITLFVIDDEQIAKVANDLKKEAMHLKPFYGTLKVHQITGTFSTDYFQRGPAKLTLKSLSCLCKEECNHFNLGVLNYAKPKLTVEDIYTDSEPELDTRENETIINLECISETKHDEHMSGSNAATTSGLRHPFNVGDFVLVKFPVKTTEYRYAGVISQIDEDEGELTITFMKICDRSGHKFRIDESDVSNITFEQIIEKLPNPDLILNGKRIYYKFKSPIPVFEK